jgi:hypothetical protein
MLFVALISLPKYVQSVLHYNNFALDVNVKGKAAPLQAWISPEGCRGLKLPEFLHNRHTKVVRLSAIRTGRLYSKEILLVLISVSG